jgi:hypothetical protein
MGATQWLHSGEEAGGAFIGGLRYGDGTLYTKDAGDLRVFWQGPTIGVDLGGVGARTMMLVYNLPRSNAIYQQVNGHRRRRLCRSWPGHDGTNVRR